MSANKKKHTTMSYYSIASTTLPINKLICKKSNQYLKTIVSSSLYYYWTEIMIQCRKVPNWMQITKLFHSYGWLYNNIPNHPNCYTKIGNTYTPVFYEILETISIMNLHFDTIYKCSGIHLGENCEYIKQAFLHNYPLQSPNHICYPGIFQNSFNHIISNHTFTDLITLSSNETNEYNYTLDLLKQLCIAVSIQKTKGVMIFKIFSVFHSLTIDLLYLVCSLYEKVYITKPLCTSPSEFSKYIVCKGFRKQKKRENIVQHYQCLYFNLCNCPSTEYVERILSITIPLYFINKIEELNSIFGQPCLEHVHNILVNYSESRIDKLKQDLYKCQEWCTKHGVIPYEHSTIPKKFSF